LLRDPAAKDLIRSQEATMKKVLFICVHNSARSQIAEALLNTMCGDAFEAESAGLEPGTLNLLAVAVLREVGIDIAGKETRGISEVIKSGKQFDCVITVCDETSSEQCPLFPGTATRLHWSLPDPSKFAGNWEERLEQTRRVRDSIEDRINEFCGSSCRLAS
jgi:arsenate reductase